MEFKFLGHSCFLITINGINLLFDPFISSNELAKDVDIETIPADYILLSHGHFDHISDCIAIAKRTHAKVIANWEIHEWLNKNGITNTHPMNTGGFWDFGDFSLKCVVAQHSSSLPDGSYGGNPMGFIVYAQHQSFYYSGDTALTLDMQLIPKWAKLDFAILPIGDNFTMGYQDAIYASDMIACDKIIGVHFDTFGYIKIDHDKLKAKFKEVHKNLTVPKIGDIIHL